MRPILTLILLAASVAVTALPAHARQYPEPSIYPVSWQLDFKHGQPKRVVVGTDAYWYMTYTVTNNTRQEQIWRPDFLLVTNEAKVVKSDHGVASEVFQKIKGNEGNRFLQPAAQVAGPLRQGEDQVREGVAIWKEPMARMGKFKIFVGGLSGEFAILKDDDGKPMMGDDKLPIILHKTFEVDFAIYGDEYYPGRDDVHQLSEVWVMR